MEMIERVSLSRELVWAVLSAILLLPSAPFIRHLHVFALIALCLLFLISVRAVQLFLFAGLMTHFEHTPARVEVDIDVELLLVMELLHVRAMNPNDVAHRRHHWQVFLSLSVNDHRCIDGGVTSTPVVEGGVHHLNCTDELSLLCAVGISRVYDDREKVEVVYLMHRVEARVLEARVHILRLQSVIVKDALPS